MATPIVAGIYEDLITNGLRIELEKLNKALIANHAEIDPVDIPRVLSRFASGLLTRVLESLSDDDREVVGTQLVNRVITEIGALSDISAGKAQLIEESPKILTSIAKALPDGSSELIPRPILALGDTTFLTNAKGEPQLLKQIESEIASAMSIYRAQVKRNKHSVVRSTFQE